jgi:hypothetical protein
MTTREEIESYLVEYQEALSAFDAQRSVTQWGAPGTMVSDAYVAVAIDEMASCRNWLPPREFSSERPELAPSQFRAAARWAAISVSSSTSRSGQGKLGRS